MIKKNTWVGYCLLISVLLTGCGQHDNDITLKMKSATISSNPPPTFLAMADSRRTSGRTLSVSTFQTVSVDRYIPTVDELFNWAEGAYSNLFSSHEETRDYFPFKYRFYPGTSLYLASDGEAIFVMGETTNWLLAQVGLISDFTGAILDSRSRSKSGAVSSIPMIKQTWDKFWKNADPLDVMYRHGVGWYKASFTINTSKVLSELPPSEWSKLPWNDSYWGSRELSAQQLLVAQSRGMKVVPWFFLSDTPQDAGRNSSPAAWRTFDLQQTASALEASTYELTSFLVSVGLRPDFYQLGAETDKGMLDFVLGGKISYPNDNFFFATDYMYNNIWKPQAILLNAAIKGVRRADPEAKVAIQAASIGNTPNNSFLLAYVNALVKEKVDFDYLGLTYPYHKGSYGGAQFLSSRVPYFQSAEYKATIGALSQLGKKIYIGEFSYPNRNFALGAGGAFKGMPDDGYPFSDYGQALWIRSFMKHCNDEPSILVCFYFYPEYFPGVEYGTNDILESAGLFLADGIPRPGLRELGRFQGSALGP